MEITSAMRLADKLKEVAFQGHEKEKALADSIDKLINHFGLDIQTKDQLFGLLSFRPPHILHRECIVASGHNPDVINLPLNLLDQDSKAALSTCSNVRWKDLDRNQRDKALKKYKRFRTRHSAFRSGNPEYAYSDLIIAKTTLLEKVVGKSFGHTRNPFLDKNYLSGPMLDTLLASLNLILFASGAPEATTVVSLIQKERRSNSKEHRGKITSKPNLQGIRLAKKLLTKL